MSSMTARDANIAAYTELKGGPVWDSATTTLSNAKVTGVTPSTITVSVDATQIFHIKGASNASFAAAPLSYTGVDNPYTVTLSDASGTWQIESLTQTPMQGQPAPVTGNAAQALGRKALRRWHRKTPHFRPRLERSVATAAYNGTNAFNYAYNWWNGYNPQYVRQANTDCMNFVSQIIHAGGEATGSVWYPYSASWINTVSFYDSQRQWYSPDNYAVHYSAVQYPAIEIGDLVAWTWGSDWQSPSHETYVMGLGYPDFYVASHTNARWNYPSSSEFAGGGSGTFYRIERPNGL
jgi:Putative amidase domain